MGLNQGMQPIAGYNYGARQLDRMVRVLNLAMMSAAVVMTVGWLFAMFLPEMCARMFTTDDTLVALSARGLTIMELVFPIVGPQMVVGNFFQCIGQVKVAIFLSLSRQLLFLLPLIALLPLVWGIDGVWASMPVADTIAAIVTAVMLIRYMRQLKKQAS